MATASTWRAALERFVNELRGVYGARLDSVVLYGSRARGEAEDEADIDTLVVLNRPEDFWVEFERISPVASRISLDYDVVISAIPAGIRDFREARDPFFLNVRREGVRVA